MSSHSARVKLLMYLIHTKTFKEAFTQPFGDLLEQMIARAPGAYREGLIDEPNAKSLEDNAKALQKVLTGKDTLRYLCENKITNNDIKKYSDAISNAGVFLPYLDVSHHSDVKTFFGGEEGFIAEWGDDKVRDFFATASKNHSNKKLSLVSKGKTLLLFKSKPKGTSLSDPKDNNYWCSANGYGCIAHQGTYCAEDETGNCVPYSDMEPPLLPPPARS